MPELLRKMTQIRLPTSSAAPGGTARYMPARLRGGRCLSVITAHVRICTALLAVSAAVAAQPQPVSAIPLRQLMAAGERAVDVSPVFLSDERVAILLRLARSPAGLAARIAVLRLAGAQLTPLAGADIGPGHELYAASAGRLILEGYPKQYLYSADLKQVQEISIRVLANSFPRSGTVGGWEIGSWQAFRLTSSLDLVRKGPGEISSLSDDVFVFRENNEVRTETADGQLLGSFRVQPETRFQVTAEIAGTGRLYREDLKDIVDLNGKKIVSLRSEPDGWGFRHGWSADGGRVLFDHFTRAVSFLRELWESAIAIVSAPDQHPTGETVRVVDTMSDAVCFNLGSPEKLLGRVGGYHADLSPSGRLVAVSTLSDLAIYRLPETCAK